VAEKSWSLQDAKNRFSAVVAAARREPQTVTKHGKPAVVVVDAAEFARLRGLDTQQPRSFADHLLMSSSDVPARYPGRIGTA
jgi:antitoxin Phd